MSGRLALTFETGGDPAATSENLDVLARGGARCTLFLHGEWAAALPDLTRRMALDHHEFGNHTYTHPNLTGCTAAQIRGELQRTDSLAQQLTGQRAFPWLRPPFGAIDDRSRRVVGGLGYHVVVRYALDGGHWQGETTSDTILARAMAMAADGAVLTFHLGSALTLRALPAVVERLQAAGHELVPVSELPDIPESVELESSSNRAP